MTTEDIFLLHAIKNSISTNWLRVIKDHMEYSSLRRSLYLPYACLISKMLVLLGVDFSNEQKMHLGSSNTFGKDSLMSLGLVKTVKGWKFMGEHVMHDITEKKEIVTTGGTHFFPETNFDKYVVNQIRVLHNKFDKLESMFGANMEMVTEDSDEEDTIEIF